MPAAHHWHLLTLAVLVTCALAGPLQPRDAPSSNPFGACAAPVEVSTSSVQVRNNTVQLTLLACPGTGALPFADNDSTSTSHSTTHTETHTETETKTKTEAETKTKTKTEVETKTKTKTEVKTKTITAPGTTQTLTYTDTETLTETDTDVETTTEVDTITETETDVFTVTDTETDTVTATSTVTFTPSPSPTPIDVCGLPCNTTCSEVGQLPPDTDDCEIIKDSIAIFQGNAAPTFSLDPLHIQQLTFGTCRFFFENLGTVPVEYCWQDLAKTGSLAATECFPPNSPFSTLAICEASDNTWEVGVSHS